MTFIERWIYCTIQIFYWLIGLGIHKKHHDESNLLFENLNNIALGNLIDNVSKLGADAVIPSVAINRHFSNHVDWL
jgi:hypothetical protein